MFSLIKKLFSDPTANWPRSVNDPVLGELRLSDDADWWEGSVSLGDRQITFKIGGEGAPDAKLVAHAHDIVRSFRSFEHLVAEFLATESREVKHLSPFADEIARLAIDDVCLFWPERPDDGMIGFKGSDQFRLWRCDYMGRKPKGLGFDS